MIILDEATAFFDSDKDVIEVAPVQTFQAYSLWRKNNQNYLSFDLERFAMEKGDLTAMRYDDNCCDYFLCFHVLEHVPDDDAAVKEIYRVLRPGGAALVGGKYLYMPDFRKVSSETLRKAAANTGISSIRVSDDMGQWVEIRKGIKDRGLRD